MIDVKSRLFAPERHILDQNLIIDSRTHLSGMCPFHISLLFAVYSPPGIDALPCS